MQTIPPSAAAPTPAPLTLAPAARAVTPESEEDIAPSQAMEYWLFAIMAASLAVSISGLAFVYGFDLAQPFSPTNISPGVRGVIVDSIMFLGVYFTRRFLMYRRKQRWHWFWGIVWLLVAVLATSFSWFSNDLAVNALGTIVTQALLNKAGFGFWSATDVNKVIAALPIVAILLYGIVPRRMKAAKNVVDTCTPEEILREAERDAARIQAARIRRKAQAEEVGEGLGEGISALTRGVNLALGRDPTVRQATRKAEEEALHQMRVLLLRHGWVETLDKATRLKPEQVRLLAESKQLWDAATHQPQPWALLPTKAEQREDLRKLALAHHWLIPEEVAEEDEMGYAALEARYADLALRAEALQEREQDHPPVLPAEPAQPAPGAAVPLQGAPLVVGSADPTAPGTEEAERDGFTPKELGKHLGKSRTTILNWMDAEDADPLKIYDSEVFRDKRGIRIAPSAFLRLSRVLAGDAAFARGDSGARKVVPKAAWSGSRQEEEAEAEGAAEHD